MQLSLLVFGGILFLASEGAVIEFGDNAAVFLPFTVLAALGLGCMIFAARWA